VNSTFLFIGLEVDVECELCDCEAPPVTLRRYGLWAATPSESRCAYSVTFLQWAEALMVTSHMSLQAIIEATRFCNRQDHREVSTACYRQLFQNGLLHSVTVLFCSLFFCDASDRCCILVLNVIKLLFNAETFVDVRCIQTASNRNIRRIPPAHVQNAYSD